MRQRLATLLAVGALLSGMLITGSVVIAAGNPSANLDQCANDPAPSPNTDGCNSAATQWVNGNLGSSKSVYAEGDSIPYRLTFQNLSLAGTRTVTIEWDTTKGGKHALDYLTTYTRSVLNANACLGITQSPACASAPHTFAIPKDPQVDNGSGSPITQAPGVFTIYGGTITAVSTYSYSNGTGFVGDKSASITISFQPSVANPVIAWGGHIAQRQAGNGSGGWGAGNAATAISGSPYHTRLLDLDGSGGNQDRSLSADAVIFPGSITIVKDATPNGSTSFGFTATPNPPLSNFSLVDDGTAANTKLFSNIKTFQTYTVNESTIPTNWGFDSVSCSVSSPNGGGFTTSTTTVNINMKEGEDWTCTYLDSQRLGTLIVIKHVVNDNGGSASASAWSIHVKSGTTDVAGSPQAGAESPGTSYSLIGGSYTVSETGGPSGYTLTGISGDCSTSGVVTVVAGTTKTCTLTNNDDAPGLTLIKHVVNDNGGTAVASAWTLHAGSNQTAGSETGTVVTTTAGTYALSETGGPTTYTNTHITCDDNPGVEVTSVTIGLGQTKSCTFVNDDNAPTLTLVKHVINDNGGTATADAWTLHAGANQVTGSESGVVATHVAGTYALSETGGPTGYTNTHLTCSNNAGVEVTSVTLALGQSITCTFVNDDNAPSLTLIKHVVNDNGGTAVASAWTLHAGSNQTAGSETGTVVTTTAGTYALSETGGPTTYTNTHITCDDNPGVEVTSVTIGLGQTKSCTFVNDDNAPTLTLVKHVINDNGGTATADAWTLHAGANQVTGSESGVVATHVAGTYALSETGGPTGYTNTHLTCSNNAGVEVTSVTLALGQSITCTFVNDDTKATPDIATVVNAQIRDNVTVTGRAPITGTVDFHLFSDSQCGTEIGSDLAVSLVSGQATSKWFTANTSGTYYWRVDYSGNQNNASRTGDCGEAIQIQSDSFPVLPVAPLGAAFGILLFWRLRAKREEQHTDDLD